MNNECTTHSYVVPIPPPYDDILWVDCYDHILLRRAPCLRTNVGSNNLNYIAIPMKRIISYSRNDAGDVVNYHVNDVSNTIKCCQFSQAQYVINDTLIRKPTERECLRLMDVDDADIDKMIAAGVGKTQLYRQAGNSIVVGVLYHIFRKMFVDTEEEEQQLTLF